MPKQVIEIDLNYLDDLLLGFAVNRGEDENGTFIMYSLGFLVFSITLYNYD